MTVGELLERLKGVRRTGNGWIALCPAHDDRDPSLSAREGKDGDVRVKCFAGCSTEAILAALGLKIKDLSSAMPRRKGKIRIKPQSSVSCVIALQPPGLTVAALAEAKRLPEAFLHHQGLGDGRYMGARAVRIPYRGPTGELLAVRYRRSLDGPQRFVWRSGDKVALYGLDRLATLRAAGWTLIVEGESDSWTAWHRGLPALGVPGKAVWRSAWAEYLAGLRVYLWQEPDAQDFTLRVAADLPGLLVIPAPAGIKDLSDAHLHGSDVVELVERIKAHAVPAAHLRRERDDARLAELRQKAEPVLLADDPMGLVNVAIRGLGYGGDLAPAQITYLAATSRVLAMRAGSMPVHLLLRGVPSAGKSYTVNASLRLLPPEGYHVIDAGSPRVLIYDDADLRHRVVVFAEADSLPAGEDNPAASAVRNLLQEHTLKYKVTVRDPETGDYRVREVVKLGPTVLITTAVKRLGPQLDSRLFSLDVPDDQEHVRCALQTQAAVELSGCAEPDPALVAFQGYLQALAPWDVVVPFVKELSATIGASAAGPRILRDFGRLLSLIKAVAVLRHRRRRTDASGRLIAEVEDFATVYDLVKNMYETTVTGASEATRKAVEAVRMLDTVSGEPVTVTAVALHLGVTKMSASRNIRTAIRRGWLVNAEQRKGYPADLGVGEPLPERTGLPSPETLRGCNAVTALTDGGALEEVDL